jgi:hypothetical protein
LWGWLDIFVEVKKQGEEDWTSLQSGGGQRSYPVHIKSSRTTSMAEFEGSYG